MRGESGLLGTLTRTQMMGGGARPAASQGIQQSYACDH